METKDQDREKKNRDQAVRKPDLDLEGPSLEKPLFRESDPDPDVDSGDWNYESLF